MIFRDIQAVIFDLDGSLADSMWIWPQIDEEYLARFGIRLEKPIGGAVDGMSFSETARYFKERFSLPDDTEKIKNDWNEMALEKYSTLVFLKEGAEAFISECRERGIRLGMATSNSRHLVDAFLHARRLKDRFDCVMTSCEVAHGKPSPDIYLAVAAGLGVEPEKCLVFEDVIPGIQAGKYAGMQVCAVEDSYSMDQNEKKRLLADGYIRSFTELFFPDEARRNIRYGEE